MVPILTYHSWQRVGTTRERNDHIALREDLKVISRLGLKTCSLLDVVNGLLTQDGDLSALEGMVAISCDDGSDWDFRDRTRQAGGRQSSFRRILFESSTLPGL